MAKAAGHLHFLGISGHTMRGVALACRQRGYIVTGTDQGAYPPGSDWLDQQRFTWWREPDPKHLKGVTGVVISGHVQADHPELRAATKQGIPVQSFAELVGELTAAARRIVVAGTHGKTTTTSLLAWIFESAGRKPDYLVGITPHNFETSVRLDGSDVAIIEGDEYRSSQLETKSKFEYYRPTAAIITSIELDHPDFFTGLDDITRRFTDLAAGLPADGRLLYWDGSPTVRDVVTAAGSPTESYGLAGADWSADDVRFEPDGLRFQLQHHGKTLTELQGLLYGAHNVANATAAAAMALEEGITVEQLAEALRTFRGASRRFERVSPAGAPVTVLDDYAHHPTEVATTIQAATLHFPGRTIAIFRPHTYSRTEKLLKEYRTAFDEADLAFIGPIEGAREGNRPPTVSGADLANQAGEHVQYYETRHDLVAAVRAALRPGDTLLCMSVNGFEGLAQELAESVR